ncbi:hypothetical protein CRM22_002512 [Opisthorchis felineus]|uniref:Apple domain-containing protein n=1 Tax=Opisthorchis felineus TaxID=147828 RepID=A0A4S2M5M7_OPIFE|nr:hypothetical protein CRM22_002512 [Opisthorchis felineus]
MHLLYLLHLLMGLIRVQSCEPIPDEHLFRGQCSLGGLLWEKRVLCGMFGTGYYRGVTQEYCEKVCKAQPDCFGFNWSEESRECQMDDSGGTFTEAYSMSLNLYTMVCCGKSAVNICGSIYSYPFITCKRYVEFRAYQ